MNINYSFISTLVLNGKRDESMGALPKSFCLRETAILVKWDATYSLHHMVGHPNIGSRCFLGLVYSAVYA